MRYWDQSFSTPEDNLACDEALLHACEAGGEEVLRVWIPQQHFVVVGYGNKVGAEVQLQSCEKMNLAILRRCTGGGAVLQGPGCLNYSLVLRIDRAPELASITSSNRFVMSRHQAVLASLLRVPVETQGHTDLAIGGLKFSGNSQRRSKHCLLFHGCFLLDVDIALMEQVLQMPSRQPAYRLNRSHTDFVINLKLPVPRLKHALQQAWNATEPLHKRPTEQIQNLTRERYGRHEWNFKF